jgi:hypothetical protein
VLLVAGIAVLMKTFGSPSIPARVEPKVPTREQSIKGLPSKGNVNAPRVVEHSQEDDGRVLLPYVDVAVRRDPR